MSGMDRLTKMADQLDENAKNAERMMELLQPEFDAFEARARHNVYVVRDYVDHMNAAKRQRQEASDIRELLAHRRASQAAPAPSDALAWIHEVHYEEGCGSNKKLTFDANHPFGVAGVDYSPEYKITSTPLHAVASSDQIKPIAEFGRGTLVVDTGHHYGTPSVFVGPSQRMGPVGGLVPDDEKMPKDRLIEGEFFFTFPTDDQAKRVADALVNAPAPSDALREALERLEAKASAVSSAHARKGNIGFAVAEMGPTIMAARAALSTPTEERQ